MLTTSQEKILDSIVSTLLKLQKTITNETIRQFIMTQIMHKTELCSKVRKLRTTQISEYCAKHKIKYK